MRNNLFYIFLLIIMLLLGCDYQYRKLTHSANYPIISKSVRVNKENSLHAEWIADSNETSTLRLSMSKYCIHQSTVKSVKTSVALPELKVKLDGLSTSFWLGSALTLSGVGYSIYDEGGTRGVLLATAGLALLGGVIYYSNNGFASLHTSKKANLIHLNQKSVVLKEVSHPCTYNTLKESSITVEFWGSGRDVKTNQQGHITIPNSIFDKHIRQASLIDIQQLLTSISGNEDLKIVLKHQHGKTLHLETRIAVPKSIQSRILTLAEEQLITTLKNKQETALQNIHSKDLDSQNRLVNQWLFQGEYPKTDRLRRYTNTVVEELLKQLCTHSKTLNNINQIKENLETIINLSNRHGILIPYRCEIEYVSRRKQLRKIETKKIEQQERAKELKLKRELHRQKKSWPGRLNKAVQACRAYKRSNPKYEQKKRILRFHNNERALEKLEHRRAKEEKKVKDLIKDADAVYSEMIDQDLEDSKRDKMLNKYDTVCSGVDL